MLIFALIFVGKRIRQTLKTLYISRFFRFVLIILYSHSTGSMLLEMETPLPVITTILGHSDSDITAVYLKTDLEKLAQCVLEPEDFANG